MHSPKIDFRIRPTNDQISLLIRENKYTDILRTDLALLDIPIDNQSLSDAVNNLKLDAEGYIEGDFNTVIINVRNASANNLIEKVGGKNRLKENIKDACLLKIATKDKDDYKEILNYVGNILASLLPYCQAIHSAFYPFLILINSPGTNPNTLLLVVPMPQQ
jgi:hypothetical protein